jgi:hypothetical protein
MTQTLLFDDLGLLEELVDRTNAVYPSILSGVKFVCVQHLLETTGSLIEAFLKLGAKPRDINLLGKSYSAGKSVFERLLKLGVNVSLNRTEGGVSGFDPVFDQAVKEQWQRVERDLTRSESFKAIVVLDDGGHCIAWIPRQIAVRHPISAIEQTASGLKRINRALREQRLPIINVALSAAKTLIEPPFVIATLMEKLRGVVPKEPTNCGVIGIGNIGRALVTELHQQGHTVFVYDKNTSAYREGMRTCKNVTELIASVDYVFGCSGDDTVRSLGWRREISGKKTFISCSSEDIEFRSLLTFIRKSKPTRAIANDPKEDLAFERGSLSIKVVRGGFPANFDDSGESVPKVDIQMTRALLLGAVLQAILCERKAGYQMLDPGVQRFVVQRWFSLNPGRKDCYEPGVRDVFNRLDSIRQRSEGSDESCRNLSRLDLG